MYCADHVRSADRQRLVYDAEYALTPADRSVTQPLPDDGTYTLYLMFVFDRWDHSNKCDVITMLGKKTRSCRS